MASLITRSGSSFMKDGKVFKFMGGNNYGLSVFNYTQTQLDSFFAYCVNNGVKVIRFWLFNLNAGATSANVNNFVYFSGGTINYSSLGFAQLDLVLARAAVAGVYLCPTLVNDTSAGGTATRADWVSWNNSINSTAYDTSVADDFWTDSNIQTAFKAYISQILNRTNTINGQAYKTDPTIMAWMLVNEMRNTTQTDTNNNTPSSARIATLTSWITTMSTYIKSIDTTHMVGTGSITQFYDYANYDASHNGSYYGQDYTAQHALSNIDFFDFHLYPYGGSPNYYLNNYGGAQDPTINGSTDRGLTLQIRQYVTVAKANSKPVIIGEWGIDRANIKNSFNYPSYPRSAHFQRMFQEFYNTGGDGIMLWHFTNLFDDTAYNIYSSAHPTTLSNLNDTDDAQLLSLMRQYAYKELSQRIPVDAVNGISM